MVFPRPIITPDALIKTRKKKERKREDGERREREQAMKIRKKGGKGIDYLSTETESG